MTAWVKADQLAELTGLSVSTIRKHSMLPACPKVKVGRAVRYDAAEYMEWLRSGGPERAREELVGELRKVHG